MVLDASSIVLRGNGFSKFGGLCGTAPALQGEINPEDGVPRRKAKHSKKSR
jgi:hypothetical protein